MKQQEREGVVTADSEVALDTVCSRQRERP